MNQILTGGYIEADSSVHKMDAFIKFICAFLLLAAVILSNTALGYIIVIALIMITVMLSHIGFKNAFGTVKRMWLFFVFILLMNALFFESVQPLWSFWIFNFSVEGTVQGLNVVFRVALAMVLGNILVATTSPLDIVDAIESLIFPLKYIGVPIRDVAMILGVAIQFIPTFIREADMIKKAQTARGARFESKKLTEKAQSVIPFVVPIFLSAFRRADELSIAMEARGYHRTKKKIKLKKRKLCKTDVFAMSISTLICIAEIFI